MLKMGLKEYSLQMQHLKLIFTCGGFFDINLKYFGGVKLMDFTKCNFLLSLLFLDGRNHIGLYNYSYTI